MGTRARIARWFRVLVYKVRVKFRRRTPPGLFVPRGFLRPEQLEEAQRLQQRLRGKKSLDQVLIELGMVGEREVLQAKAQGMGMPFIDLDRQAIDEAAINSISASICRKHQAIPVKRQDRVLWVAMAHPENIKAIDEMASHSTCRVIPVVAIPSDIDRAITENYVEETH